MSVPIKIGWLRTAVPNPFTVLGLKLRPLSIGHITLMQWQCVAYGTGGKPLLGDLISGCLICSMTFRGYQEFLQRPDVEKQIFKLGRTFRKFSNQAEIAEIVAKFDLFDRYLTEGTETPSFELPNGAAQGLAAGAPWLQCLRAGLMSRLHVPSEETWDYSYRQAVWDLCTVREQEGGLQILEPDEDNIAEHAQNIAAMEAVNEEIRRLMGFTAPPPAPAAQEVQNGS